MTGNGLEGKSDVIRYAQLLATSGLTHGTSGNVSVRSKNGFLITPSGIPYEDLTENLIVEMSLDGGYWGDTLPSSEWQMHRDVYRSYPDATAVIHCHSARATALSCLRRSIPAFHYMVAAAGGKSIECAEYATFGTKALSEAMLAALGPRRACLLANHGQIAFGASLYRAFALAVEVEALADQYMSALSIGEPAILSQEEMDRILAKFRSYGKQLDELSDDAPDAFEHPRHLGASDTKGGL
ncbi:class II aldolase [Rhodobacteraceae bacterium RKSG542]|uniref:class II aldolase/adducin family protein n=1 Tax=Pseudovibrio flavus TaxID=2529854 RepID=UPI0012BBF8F6|nr:class II aldolase/adducin family protein [Pseudovibrio flavus]MTI17008.1 class II aldolase [Pseudovibrio flavus]